MATPTDFFELYRTFEEMETEKDFMQYLERLRSGTPGDSQSSTSASPAPGINRALARLSHNNDILFESLQRLRNLMIVCDGDISWDHTSGALVAPSIDIRAVGELGATAVSSTGALTTSGATINTDGKLLYVTLDLDTDDPSLAYGIGSSWAAFVALFSANKDKRFLYKWLFYRDGNDIILWDGTRLKSGQKIKAGRNTLYAEREKSTQDRNTYIRPTTNAHWWLSGTKVLTIAAFELIRPGVPTVSVANTSVALSGKDCVYGYFGRSGGTTTVSGGILANLDTNDSGDRDDLIIIGTFHHPDPSNQQTYNFTFVDFYGVAHEFGEQYVPGADERSSLRIHNISTSYDLKLQVYHNSAAALTADRKLEFYVKNADRRLTLGADVSLNQDLQTTDSVTFGDVKLQDTSQDHTLAVSCNENLAANRTLGITVADAAATLAIEGTSCAINQDTTSDADVTFNTVQLDGGIVKDSNGDTALTINTSGDVKAERLLVAGAGSDLVGGLEIYAETGGLGPHIFTFAKGSTSGTGALVHGQGLFRLRGNGYNANQSNYDSAAYIDCFIDTSLNSSNIGLQDNDTPARLNFGVSPGGGTAASLAMTITPTGRVGIGETTSVALTGTLQVKGSATSSDEAIIVWRNAGDDATGFLGYDGDEDRILIGSYNNTALSFCTNGTANEHLTIETSGLVSVGDKFRFSKLVNHADYTVAEIPTDNDGGVNFLSNVNGPYTDLTYACRAQFGGQVHIRPSVLVDTPLPLGAAALNGWSVASGQVVGSGSMGGVSPLTSMNYVELNTGTSVAGYRYLWMNTAIPANTAVRLSFFLSRSTTTSLAASGGYPIEIGWSDGSSPNALSNVTVLLTKDISGIVPTYSGTYLSDFKIEVDFIGITSDFKIVIRQRGYSSSGAIGTDDRVRIGGVQVYSRYGEDRSILKIRSLYSGVSPDAHDLIKFMSSSGTQIGEVSQGQDGDLTYGSFTGAHRGVPLDEETLPGHLVSIVEVLIVGRDSREPLYSVSSSCTAQDKGCLGVLGGARESNSSEHLILCVGNGYLRVCSEGGDIEIGDLLCSSTVAGHAMKQDDDLVHAYSVAKATEVVVWSTHTDEEGTLLTTKEISCIYMGG